MSEVIIIAAMSKNRVIGKDGGIPWHISEDFKRFKALTSGYCCIMGRKTYESLPVKPLPKRENLILSSKELNYPGTITFNDMASAITYAKKKHDKVFIIGGSKVFDEGMKYADLLELTLIDKEIEGDTFFPRMNPQKFKEVARVEMNDEKVGKYYFVTYKKI